MKKLQIVLSGFLLACISGIFYNALTSPGPMQNYGIAFSFILTIGGIVLLCISLKESDEDDNTE